MALTATATSRVKDDIIASLGLHHTFVSISSLDRSNLRISVVKKKSFDADMKV